ncbi:hypothetical protein HNY73_020421 [Argiope bruennichi]|uniref:BHLH domain-containing protein n=1 Tax=Argiope bruennichi TaxID=94029 RepID=A0A8T0EAI2_ARGBR|nr:hypothetical protein HNY73_020421 [Argiope bruennichi]
MAAMTMDLTAHLNSANCVTADLQIPMGPEFDETFHISSVDLFSLIEEDHEAFKASHSHPWEEIRNSDEDDSCKPDVKEFAAPFYTSGRVDMGQYLTKPQFGLGQFCFVYDDPLYLPEPHSIMVNPRDCTLTDPFLHPNSSQKLMPTEPQVLPKPYHPSQDHDYFSMKEDEVKNDTEKRESFCEEDPDVEVWEIENFLDSQALPAPVPEQLPVYRPFRKETRRSSARTAEIRRREQARKISNAVHAVLKTGRVRSTRQFKNIKPKNSVETTPSQSDIEEFYSQPVRQTYSRTTKKKTCKGRIDHSESERHRREVLRRNFSSLCDLIPNEYLRGDKVSSQISKQKILNGAKSYITAVHSAKSSYKTQYHQNSLLRERWQKVQAKLLKSLKRQK